MQCSKPAAAKAATGGIAVRIRSVLVRALKHIHTARHTSALHMTPSANAGTNGIAAFALAVFRATRPTAPPPNLYCAVRKVRAAVRMAPTALPVNDRNQLSSNARVFTLPLAHALTTR